MLKRFVEMIGVCCLMLFTVEAAAESAVPIEKEPAHRLVLQNAQVRVFEVSLPPGATTSAFTSSQAAIAVRLADATIEELPEGGKPRTVQLRRGDVSHESSPTTSTRRIRNVGKTPFHAVYVELLPQGSAAPTRSTAPPDWRVELDNERVRVMRRILASGESTTMHTHASGTVGVHVTAGRMEVSFTGGTNTSRDVKAGGVQWMKPGTTHALKNVGFAPIEIVDIEPK